MAIYEIPLTADNQQFSIDIGSRTYRMTLLWRDLYWIMDLSNDRGEALVSGVPLVAGVDLLAQYAHLEPGFQLAVVCDDSKQDYPTKIDLGSRSHLLISTE